MNSTESSTFQNSTLSLEQKLEKARAELLDLGARNRLLNIPRSKNTRFLEVIDERSELVYNLLFNEKRHSPFCMVNQEKKMTKRPKRVFQKKNLLFINLMSQMLK
ncbi:DUF4011 domain-containing protein [Enterobacter cloacae]